MLEAATFYAALGWPVLPIWPIRGGSCSCGEGACEHPGKHPVGSLAPHSFKDATTDLRTLEAWAAQVPDLNLAIATGDLSGIFVLDIDPRHGGDVSLELLEEEFGRLPDTVEVHTGGGGRHLYFKTEPGLGSSTGRAGPGLDIKANGGYVLVPPSNHISGGRYIFEVSSHAGNVEPAAAPPWLLEKIRAPERGPAAPVGPSIPAGGRNDTLTSLAGTMRRRGMDEAAIAAALLVENEQKCDPPLPEAEVRAIAKSVAGYAPSSNGRGPTGGESVPWPEPMAAAAFYGIAGEAVRAIAPHTEADPAALLLNFLVAAGSAIGRGAWAQVGATRHHLALYSALVGETAKARKGTSWDPVRELFARVDPVWAEDHVVSGLSSGEGIIWAVRDPIERKVKGETVTEPGVEDKRLLVVEGEFASLLAVMGREGNTLSPVIRLAWDHGALRTLTKNSPARATGAHISILGHVTRHELLRHLNDTEMANGFANRFLWACTRRARVLPEGGGPPRFGDLVPRLHSLLDRARGLGEIARDEEARAAWADIYPDLSEGRPGLFGAVTARAEAQALRLQALYATLDGTDTISREHLAAAMAVWDYCDASARYIFGDALGDPVADQIMEAVRGEPGGLTRTEISNLFGRNMQAARLTVALNTLQEQGKVAQGQRETGGRPAEFWYAV
jgi:hypothetical protein